MRNKEGQFVKGIKPHNADTRRYLNKECKNCGSDFKETYCKTSKRLFCSKACATQYRYLSKDTAINNYKCTLSQRIRTKQKYKQWRNDIVERDKVCQHCSFEGSLDAHHIIPVNQIISENKLQTISEILNCPKMWDRRNGIAYCNPCHKMLEKIIPGVGA